MAGQQTTTPENPANHRPLLRVSIVVVVVGRLSTCPTDPVLYPVSMLNTLPPREWLDLRPLEMQQTFVHEAVPPLNTRWRIFPLNPTRLLITSLDINIQIPGKVQVQPPLSDNYGELYRFFFPPSVALLVLYSCMATHSLSLINIWWPSKLVFLQCRGGIAF